MSVARVVDKTLARLSALRRARVSPQHWLLVAGDSLCTGRAPFLLGRMLRAAGAEVGIVTAAQGGITGVELAGILAGLRTSIHRGPPEVVIALVGGNHARRGQSPAGQAIVEAVGSCLAEISSRWPHSPTVLCTVPIPGRHPALRADAPALIASLINPSIRAAARGHGTLLCDLETVFENAPGARSDGIHPTASGDRLLAERWFQAVWPLLARVP